MRKLDHESSALMNGINVLIRGGQRAGLFSFHHVGTQEAAFSLQPGKRLSPEPDQDGALISDF